MRMKQSPATTLSFSSRSCRNEQRFRCTTRELQFQVTWILSRRQGEKRSKRIKSITTTTWRSLKHSIDFFGAEKRSDVDHWGRDWDDHSKKSLMEIQLILINLLFLHGRMKISGRYSIHLSTINQNELNWRIYFSKGLKSEWIDFGDCQWILLGHHWIVIPWSFSLGLFT